jgi:hypothetical protein
MTNRLAALIAVLFLAACTDASPPVPAAPVLSRTSDPQGRDDSLLVGHVMRPLRAGQRDGPSGSIRDTTDPILYHGGSIIYKPKVAVLYWSNRAIYQGGPTPPSTDSGSRDSSLMGFFLNNFGGSNYHNTMTTYYDGTSRYIQNSLHYTQYWATNREAPAAGDTVHVGIIKEVLEFGFNTDSLPYDPDSTIYVFVTDSGVDWGLNGRGYFEAGDFCAYHGITTVPGYGTIRFAAIPHQYDVPVCDLLVGSPNNDPAGDAVLDALVHEIEEVTTDPDTLGGWYDYRHGEVADKCLEAYDPHYHAKNGADANVHLGGGDGKDVYIQRMWKNVDIQQCAFFSLTMSGPANPPTAGTYVWTANPAGNPADYTYQWYSRDQGGSTEPYRRRRSRCILMARDPTSRSWTRLLTPLGKPKPTRSSFTHHPHPPRSRSTGRASFRRKTYTRSRPPLRTLAARPVTTGMISTASARPARGGAIRL